MQALLTRLSEVTVPKTIDEALKNAKWRKVVLEEMKALESNGTWDVVQQPKGTKVVGCKWVFTIKYKADGSIGRYKARLVAKGYTQTYGIDYQETFSPVAKINTIQMLLSLVANLDWSLQQFDVKNAFLNGDLEEEVYMDLPPGFDSKSKNGKICKLKKSLYGLKQSPRAWCDRFSNVIQRHGFRQAQTDHTLFLKLQGGKKTILIVYLDDRILSGDDIVEIEEIKGKLAKEFEMKVLGTLRYFLGMEIVRNKTGISVSQWKYVLDLLKETGMMSCKPANTPVDPNLKLEINGDDEPMDKGRYQRLVGRLIYLAHTRPYITFSVSFISQFMHSPSVSHMYAVYRILRYLKGTPWKGLFFKKNKERSAEVFVDAGLGWFGC